MVMSCAHRAMPAIPPTQQKTASTNQNPFQNQAWNRLDGATKEESCP